VKIGLVYELTDAGPRPGPLKRTAPLRLNLPDHTAEWASDDEIQIIAETLAGLGHQVEHIGDLEKLLRFVADGGRVDLIFNYAAGIQGEAREAQVPALLEALRLPYTGADPFSLTVCLDKAVTKRLWQSAGLPTPEFACVAEVGQLAALQGDLPPFPLFVKPAREGSSKGITPRSRVDSPAGLAERVAEVIERYQQPALIEAYLPGREYSVAVLGSRGSARALGAAEIAPGAGGVLDVKAKKAFGAHSFAPVADVGLRAELVDLGLRGYQAADCQVIGRLDFRLDPTGRPQLLEINPNPGLHPQRSILPAIARHQGWGYADLIAAVVAMARERWGLDAGSGVN
jgi:D-alanine-D-alanine ligase